MTPTASAPATIRRAATTDLTRIERLLGESNLPLLGVREALENFHVALDGADLVGVAGLEIRGDHALLRSVAVKPEWRSRGVGRALVHAVIADAEERGIQALYLLTTTAERYFPTFGFQVISREQVPDELQDTGEFRVACPDTATVMRKAIDKR